MALELERDMAERPFAVERHLFIAGCPRSGTSALVFLLNEHPQLAIGFERFKRVRALLDPFHFSEEQFFSPLLVECDSRGPLMYARLRERWRTGKVLIAGDKVPLYTRVLPQLLGRFPQSRVVVLVRELPAVAASFARRAGDPADWWPSENDHRLAAQLWNEALERTREADAMGHSERIFLLPYEAFFGGEERWLSALLEFLDVSPTTRLRCEHQRLARRGAENGSQSGARPTGHGLRQDELEYLDRHQDLALKAWSESRMTRQLTDAPSPRAISPELDEPALSDLEISQRERERNELLAEMRHPGLVASDEIEVLERRLLAQAAELARRGERLSK